MAVARDWKVLAEDGVDSAYETEKLSPRVRRALAANAADGKPHGRIPFGFQRSYHPRTKELVGQEPYEPEAVIVRELYDRLRHGDALTAIARDFDQRGVRTRSGKPFKPQHLRDLAMRAAYAGIRTNGNASGRRDVYSLAGATKATWPPLVSREVYFEVRQRLTRADRKTSRPGRGVHLLSMIARCDPCGAALAATYRTGTRQYQCHGGRGGGGHVRIDADELDELATAAMLGYLARPDVYEEWGRDRGTDAEIARVRECLSEARSDLEELRTAAAAGRVSVATLIAVEPAKVARVAKLEAQERELSTPPMLRSLITPGADVARRWRTAPMTVRREVARLLLSPDLLGELRVQRRPAGWYQATHMPVRDRVTWKCSD
jgi:hypothetical protein